MHLQHIKIRANIPSLKQSTNTSQKQRKKCLKTIRSFGKNSVAFKIYAKKKNLLKIRKQNKPILHSKGTPFFIVSHLYAVRNCCREILWTIHYDQKAKT